MQTLIQTVVDPFQAVLIRFLDILPLTLWALILLGLGVLAARILRELAEKLMTTAKVDHWSGKIGLDALTERLGLGRSPAKIVGVLVWWFVFLVFFTSAANTLRLDVVSQLLNRLTLFIPHVIAAVFILSVGVFVSAVARDIVFNTCCANHIKEAGTVAKLARVAIILFAAFMALEQLGIAPSVTTSTLQILLGSIGLAFAIAFGLGGKEVASEILRNLTRKE